MKKFAKYLSIFFCMYGAAALFGIYASKALFWFCDWLYSLGLKDWQIQAVVISSIVALASSAAAISHGRGKP